MSTAPGHRAWRIALTGGIATGKSHVRATLASMGVPTIDADQEAREAVAPGTPGWRAVRDRFGDAVVGADGHLDRKALAGIVFSDAAARRDLEAIVHPAVRSAIDEWFTALGSTGAPLGVADIPLLFETGRQTEFDGVIVVACSPEIQLRRLMARDHLSEEDATRRIRAQLPIEDKTRVADWVIRTDGTFDQTTAQTHAMLQQLRARYAAPAGDDAR